MRFKAQLVVLGAKSSKGDFNGKPYDSTTVFIQTDLQEGDRFCGLVGDFLKWGTSENFEKIKHHSYPARFEASLEQVSNGKNSVTIIKDMVLVKDTPVKA